MSNISTLPQENDRIQDTLSQSKPISGNTIHEEVAKALDRLPRIGSTDKSRILEYLNDLEKINAPVTIKDLIKAGVFSGEDSLINIEESSPVPGPSVPRTLRDPNLDLNEETSFLGEPSSPKSEYGSQSTSPTSSTFYHEEATPETSPSRSEFSNDGESNSGNNRSQENIKIDPNNKGKGREQ